MDYATVRAQVVTLAATAIAPTLTDAEIEQALYAARRKDANGYVAYDAWAALTVYAVGAAWYRDADGLPAPGATIRVPTVNNGHLYAATTGGTSGATEPTWPTASGGTVTDGSVVWTERGAYYWTPTYALKQAVGTAWLIKAGKLATQYEVSVGSGKTFKRDQQWRHCMDMAASYGVGGGSDGRANGGGGGRIGSARLGTATATGD